MSIDNFFIKNIIGSNRISDDFNNLNLNDNGLYQIIYNHVKGLADKHVISDIVNDSNVTGANIKDVVEFIYTAFLKHITGEDNRHNSSNIDNDSIIYGETLNDVLEYLKNYIYEHIASPMAHEAIDITFNSNDISELTADDVQEAIRQLNIRISNIVISGGDSNPEVVDSRNSAVWNIIFNTLKERLDYTETELWETKQRTSLLDYMVLQNDLYVPLKTDDDEITLLVDDDGSSLVADWKYQYKEA